MAEALGWVGQARSLALETLALVGTIPEAEATVFLSFWLLRAHSSAGLEGELRAIVERAPTGRWKDIASACLDREFSRAADVWLETGSPTWEAYLRERAAELISEGRRAEGEAELDRAIAFYRSVGATFFIGRCEALMREPKTA